ncbi:NAD(P)-dependent alcohol dehydrogenase [Pseudomonas sp. NPDC089422]|uniref:NAD(P)-dependent alcohol dehydrogenase n=1 Tax=Pseudomonas sp. NPDC089422 TaxID=3364466 RepID=UPI00381DFD0E
MKMRAARMHGYKQPLVIEEVDVPDILPTEVLVRVEAAGMCRTDFQLVDGYFTALNLPFPATPGHEIAGSIAAVGTSVPAASGLAKGDQVVVVGGWGCGECDQCRVGNHQICGNGRWPGFGLYGGYGEYVPVPYQWLIRLGSESNLKPEELAPLTDAGLTPYRGIKKLQQAGVLGPNSILAVNGLGGLGMYAVQYAKLLSGGSVVVALARSDEKLAIAKEFGADVTINVKGKSLEQVRKDLIRETGRGEFNAVIDCSGAEESIRLGTGMLATSGAYCSVGLVGNRIDIPLFPLVAREYTYYGSFWGNYVDLSEVIELAKKGQIKHQINIVKFEDVNDCLDRLRDSDFVGRAVLTYK